MDTECLDYISKQQRVKTGGEPKIQLQNTPEITSEVLET